MQTLNHLLKQNKKWADKMKESDPDFFTKLSEQQQPEYLWVGCSDSRVSANAIVSTRPGDMFVHRNIANLVIHTDLNCLSVIQYAIEVLTVKHIIICGHYNCGGIRAAMDNNEHGLIDDWLRPIRELYSYHQARIDALQTEKERVNLLCEINVVEQVANTCRTTFVQGAWKCGQELAVHGWIYNIENGVLRDLNVSATSLDEIPQIDRIE